MGCNCKNKPRQQPQVIMSTPVPDNAFYGGTAERIPQTPEELHAQQMNEWNGGNIKIEEDKEEN